MLEYEFPKFERNGIRSIKRNLIPKFGHRARPPRISLGSIIGKSQINNPKRLNDVEVFLLQ